MTTVDDLALCLYTVCAGAFLDLFFAVQPPNAI